MALYNVSFSVEARNAATVKHKVRTAFLKMRRRFSGPLGLTIEKVREKSAAEIVAMVAESIDEATNTLEELNTDLQCKLANLPGNLQASEEGEHLQQMIQSLDQLLANLYACEFPMLEPQTELTAAQLRLGDDDDVSLPVQ
jgi:hypothetical protein